MRTDLSSRDQLQKVSQVARLLASENLTIQHAKIDTAQFDVKSRLLRLPILADMEGDVYDMFVGHEVGHALWTKCGLDEAAKMVVADPTIRNMGRAFFDKIGQTGLADAQIDTLLMQGSGSFANVVEDIRIEKLIKERYPGLRQVFVRAYLELMHRDFFGIEAGKRKGIKMESLQLIDRINIFAKAGIQANVPFLNDEERDIVDKAMKVSSFTESIEIARAIYMYDWNTVKKQKEAEERKKKEEERKKQQEQKKKEQEEQKKKDAAEKQKQDEQKKKDAEKEPKPSEDEKGDEQKNDQDQEGEDSDQDGQEQKSDKGKKGKKGKKGDADGEPSDEDGDEDGEEGEGDSDGKESDSKSGNWKKSKKDTGRGKPTKQEEGEEGEDVDEDGENSDKEDSENGDEGEGEDSEGESEDGEGKDGKKKDKSKDGKEGDGEPEESEDGEGSAPNGGFPEEQDDEMRQGKEGQEGEGQESEGSGQESEGEEGDGEESGSTPQKPKSQDGDEGDIPFVYGKDKSAEGGESQDGDGTMEAKYIDKIDTSDVAPPEPSATNENWNKNVKQLNDENAPEIHYLTVPKSNLKYIVVDYKKVHENIRKYYANGNPSALVKGEKKFTEFQREQGKTIDYLHKEFEMKKRAEQYNTMRTAKTGELDMTKLPQYLFNDEIFETTEIIQDGKSHGFILIIDWSYSMQNTIPGMIEQLLTIALFCRKAGIPFDAYSFTAGRYGFENSKPAFDLVPGDLNLTQNFEMRQYLSSRMTRMEFFAGCSNLMAMIGNGRFSNVPGEDELIGNTPLTEAVVAGFGLAEDFRKRNRVEVVNMVYLTDGGGNSVTGYLAPNKRQSAFNRFDKYFVEDPMTRKQLVFDPNDFQSKVLIEMLRERKAVNVVGMFATSDPIYGCQSFEAKPHAEAKAEFDKNGFVSCKAAGYNEFYVIPNGDNLKIGNENLNIDTSFGKVVSDKNMQKALMDQGVGRVKNRVMLSRFISQISEFKQGFKAGAAPTNRR